VTAVASVDPGLEIRPFVEADRMALVDLWRRCDLVRPWNDPDSDIDRKLALGDELLLVARRDGTIVGGVMVGYDGHRGWLNYLAVDQDEQRSGLGRRLVREAERRLLSLGCPKINLQIRRTNLDAVAFYESLGYVEDDAISMGKRLIHDEPLAE
jgi:ribosomal protein S18 acetylase RimI-like enzyme